MKVTNTTTFSELLNILSSINDTPIEKEARRPGSRKLRTENELIAKTKIGEDGSCEVYQNGYAVYDNGDRKTVLWIRDCSSATYYFTQLRDNEKDYQSETDLLDEKALGALPWYYALMIAGENQITMTLDHPRSEGTTSDADLMTVLDTKPSAYWVNGVRFPDPEEAYLRKEAHEERMALLTDRQRQVCELYYELGYTQREIGELLGIDRRTVASLLRKTAHKLS